MSACLGLTYWNSGFKKKEKYPHVWKKKSKYSPRHELKGDHILSHSLTCLKAKSDSDSSSDIAQESYIKLWYYIIGIKLLDFLKIKDVRSFNKIVWIKKTHTHTQQLIEKWIHLL